MNMHCSDAARIVIQSKFYLHQFLNKVHHADCLELMQKLPENSIDTIITDPPYGLSFMGKEWDKGVPGTKFWEAMLRVAKPGCILLSFGGTRTFHRIACNIEDAGWQIRDCMMWLYGSGFPKSLNIGKAIDKMQGNKRKVIGLNPNNRPNSMTKNPISLISKLHSSVNITKGNSEWEGWGTSLKPAFEPIIVAMKPLDGNFVNNALRHGVAGLNIDDARIGTSGAVKKVNIKSNSASHGGKGFGCNVPLQPINKGRWPANVILDEEAGRLLDTQSGTLKSGAMKKAYLYTNTGTSMGKPTGHTKQIHDANIGGASRFFYCAKASKKERTMQGKVENNHPTVKPLALMQYLCTLTKTPTGGIVLDPFSGSGSTGIAAVQTGRKYILIDKAIKSVWIARKRIKVIK